MATRASTRLRTRSAKAVEAEHTENLLAAARGKRGTTVDPDRQESSNGQPDPSQHGNALVSEQKETADGVTEGKGKRKPSTRQRRKKTYCVCQEDERGEMIECECCKDWFHFDCIALSVEDAEKIQTYACSSCTESKGITTSYTDPAGSSHTAVDGASSKPNSESQAKVLAAKPSKRKATVKKSQPSPSAGISPHTEHGEGGEDNNASNEELHSSSSSSNDPGSEAVLSEDDYNEEADNDYDGEQSRKRPRMQTLRSKDAKKRLSLPLAERRSSGTIVSPRSPTTPTTPGNLPPARKYVADKMAAVIRTVIADGISEADANEYGAKVEAALFSALNETINGKPTAGGRYKAQFNLLHGALSKFQDLNPELIASIRNQTLTAAKVAALNSTDLANAEQRAVIEKAEAEALRQHVRIKDADEAIQAGRDGLEFLQDARETEMMKIRRQEADARERERQREMGEDESPSEASRRTSVDVSQSPVAVVPASPTVDKVEKPQPARKVSAPTLSIRRPSTGISSAWGDKKSESNEFDSIDIGEQEVDLSDMVPDTAFSDEDDEMRLGDDDLTEIRKQAPGWLGGIINPAVQAPPVPVELRHLTSTPLPAAHWSRLIPQPSITITGRVPTATSLKYLSDRRQDRGKQLQPVLLSLPPQASQADKDAFRTLVDFHVSRDRHGIYHPFGDRPPPGTAREVYLIPLRANDAVPALLLELGATVPGSRNEPVVVAVFVAPAPAVPHMKSPMERTVAHQSPFAAPYDTHGHHPSQSPHTHGPSPSGPAKPRCGPPPNVPTAPRGPPNPAPLGPKSTLAAVSGAAPVLPNSQLQALMASLDANAIANVAKSPLTGSNSPAQGPYAPPSTAYMPSSMQTVPPGNFGAVPRPPPHTQALPYASFGGQSPYSPSPVPYGNQSPHQQNHNPYDQNAGGYSPSGYQRSPGWG